MTSKDKCAPEKEQETKPLQELVLKRQEELKKSNFWLMKEKERLRREAVRHQLQRYSVIRRQQFLEEEKLKWMAENGKVKLFRLDYYPYDFGLPLTRYRIEEN